MSNFILNMFKSSLIHTAINTTSPKPFNFHKFNAKFSSQFEDKFLLQLSVTMMSWVRVWLEMVYNWVFWKTATRYIKAKRMGIKEILRRIWLISTNKIKASESICKQSGQVKLKLKSSIIVTNNCHIHAVLELKVLFFLSIQYIGKLLHRGILFYHKHRFFKVGTIIQVQDLLSYYKPTFAAISKTPFSKARISGLCLESDEQRFLCSLSASNSLSPMVKLEKL